MKTKDLSKLPEGAILLVVKNSNGTFSPLGINPDQGRIITAFIGKLSEEQPLVVAISSSQRNRVNNQIIKPTC